MSDDEVVVVAVPKFYSCPSLKSICVQTLGRYRAYLGDLGYIDAESVRSICAQCTREQLTTIEDTTLTGSKRAIHWYIWHIWYRICNGELGKVELDKVPRLLGRPPEDYTPPLGISVPEGDYRLYYKQRKLELEKRAIIAKQKIAAAYELEDMRKESRKAKMIEKVVPEKRRNHGAAAAPKVKVKVPQELKNADNKLLRQLGMATKGRSSIKPAPAGMYRASPSVPRPAVCNIERAAFLSKSPASKLQAPRANVPYGQQRPAPMPSCPGSSSARSVAAHPAAPASRGLPPAAGQAKRPAEPSALSPSPPAKTPRTSVASGVSADRAAACGMRTPWQPKPLEPTAAKVAQEPAPAPIVSTEPKGLAAAVQALRQQQQQRKPRGPGLSAINDDDLF